MTRVYCDLGNSVASSWSGFPMSLLLVAAAWAGILDQAIEIRRAGDLVGAASLLDALHPLVDEADEGRWLLERGIVEELAWRQKAAEPYLRAAIELGGDVGLEARYHLVVVLDDLGRGGEASDELRALQSAHGLNPDFVPVLRIQAGVLDVRAGRTARGQRQIRRGLADVKDADRHSWMVGRGRFALLDSAADRGDRLSLTTRSAKLRRDLRERVRALSEAEKLLYEVIKTEEPEWITSALLRVGDTYAALADDLVVSPPPASLTEDQAAIYRVEIARKAEGPRTKALLCYDRGVSYAKQVAWEGEVVAVLKERRELLSSSKEGSAASDAWE